jgi:Tol biopolymer transport system component
MWGNLRADPVTWSAAGPGIAVTSAGVVIASAVGRYTITVTSSRGSRSGFVSVVPPGRLAAASGPYGSGNLFTADLDGANRATVATVNDGGIGAHPAWIPGTSTIVYTSYMNGLQRLYKVGPDGNATLFFATTPPNVSHQAEPTPSADGQWLYFSAYDTRCSANAYCLYRAKIDGSAPELLGSYISTSSATWRPAPSPDGSRVAFMIGDPLGGGTIRVFDVATRTVSSWGVPGESPAWSPDGARIAYVSGNSTLALIDPDGTGARTLTSPGLIFSRPISWSPDGKWLVAPSQGTLHLVDTATGADLPLAWTSGLYAGSLK